MNRFKTISILAFALCTLQACWAAVPTEETRSREVYYADLDLSHPADAAVLRGRIERAADSVCGPLTLRDLSSRARFNRCKSGAVEQALADVRPARLAGTGRTPFAR